jgi:hypothetical protein
MVIELRFGKQIDDTAARPGFGIRRTEYQPLDPGVLYGTGAHGAGL